MLIIALICVFFLAFFAASRSSGAAHSRRKNDVRAKLLVDTVLAAAITFLFYFLT